MPALNCHPRKALDTPCTLLPDAIPHFSSASVFFDNLNEKAVPSPAFIDKGSFPGPREPEKHLSRLAPTSVTFSNISFNCNKTSSHTRAAPCCVFRFRTPRIQCDGRCGGAGSASKVVVIFWI